jgi:hypothetical protein
MDKDIDNELSDWLSELIEIQAELNRPVEYFKVGDIALYRAAYSPKKVTIIKIVTRPFPYQVQFEDGTTSYVHHNALSENLAIQRENKINTVLRFEEKKDSI